MIVMPGRPSQVEPLPRGLCYVLLSLSWERPHSSAPGHTFPSPRATSLLDPSGFQLMLSAALSYIPWQFPAMWTPSGRILLGGRKEVPMYTGVLSMTQLAWKGHHTPSSDPSWASGHMALALRPLRLPGLSVLERMPG